jgi:O-antigen/teichoic acid export membrane protein
MSNIRKNGREMMEKRELSLKDARKQRDALANSVDTLGFDEDEIATTGWPDFDIPGLSVSAELRAISMPLPVFPSLPRAVDTSWITEEQTWMLPAIPKSATTDTQKSSPTTQDKTKEKAQTGASAQSYLSLALEMVKSSGIYAVGALMSPLVSLILTPFLAHNLSNTEYGGLAVLYTVVDLVTVATQLGLSPAFFRAYNSDYESARDRSGILATTITLLTFASLPVAIAIMLLAPWLSELLFNTPAFSISVVFTAVVIVMENLALPGISWLRAEKRPLLYSALSTVNLLVVLGTNIGLVGVLHAGVNGALIAKGAGFAAMIVCTLPFILLRLARERNLHLRFDIMWSMLTFGIPTIFSDIAAWVLQLSDRYLLSHFGSLAQTASYSVAYTLGGVLSPVILAPWGLAWIPIMYSIAKRDDAPHIFKLVFRWWSSVLLFAAFGLSLLSILVLATLFPPSYQAAEPVIPIITLSTMLTGVWYIFMIGVNIRRKTILEFVYVIIAASVNLLLNLVLIPYYGAIGAAVSTLLAYILLVIVSYVVNQRIYPVGFEIGSFTLRLAIGVALYVGDTFLTHAQKPLISWSVSIATLLLYGVILLLLGGITPRKIINIFRFIQDALRKQSRKAHA